MQYVNRGGGWAVIGFLCPDEVIHSRIMRHLRSPGPRALLIAFAAVAQAIVASRAASTCRIGSIMAATERHVGRADGRARSQMSRLGSCSRHPRCRRRAGGDQWLPIVATRAPDIVVMLAMAFVWCRFALRTTETAQAQLCHGHGS